MASSSELSPLRTEEYLSKGKRKRINLELGGMGFEIGFEVGIHRLR